MKKYDETTLKKLQEIELEMLHDFVEICKKSILTSGLPLRGQPLRPLRGQLPFQGSLFLCPKKFPYFTKL